MTSLATGRTGSPASNSRFTPLLFGASGITPIGYALFAFALGVTAGLLIRRTVPAMAVTLAVFAAIQIVMPQWIRPHLMTPLTATAPLDTAAISGLRYDGPRLTVFPSVNLPDAWILSARTTMASGQLYTGPTPKDCLDFSFQRCQAALGKLNLRQVTIYQPATRYWAFQWIETSIFVILALALAGLCLWWIRQRRLS